MARLTVEESKDFSVLPKETIVLVECLEVRGPVDVPGKDGKDGWQKFDFKFAIRDIPAQLAAEEGYRELIGTNIYGSTSTHLNQRPDNKLRRWSEALLNIGELGVGFELDTDMLEGRSCRAIVENYDRRLGGKGHKVLDLLASAGPIATAAPINIPQPALAAAAAAGLEWTDEPPF